MTTTTREELLTLLRANLTPDPLVHWPYCPHCGHGDPLGHKDGCSWWRANEIAFDASIGELEFEDDDDAKEPTRPGQRVRCVMPKEGVFNLGDEFVVAWLCGGDVQFEGRDDWWPKWWFEVIPGPPPEGEQAELPVEPELEEVFGFWCEPCGGGPFRYATAAHDSMVWLNQEYYNCGQVADFLSKYRILGNPRLPDWLRKALT